MSSASPSSRNFWLSLPKPFFVLAPMADVTDPAFRTLIAKYGKPDVFWTEFVSADGLASAGREHLMRDLAYAPAERPIVAQLFSSHPDKIEEAAQLCTSLGFDGIDINMGCPDRNVEKQGAGASLMKSPALAQEILKAAKRGAGGIPVSVKTRMGWAKDDLETWIPALLEAEPAVITLHARTRKELSLVPAHWDAVEKAAGLIRAHNAQHTDRDPVLLIGNGDALSIADASAKAAASGADGVMLGRAIFGNPWLFAANPEPRTIQTQLTVMLEHTDLFATMLGDIKSFAIMKKHYKAYVSGWDGARELRTTLMEEATNAQEVRRIVEAFLDTHTELSESVVPSTQG